MLLLEALKWDVSRITPHDVLDHLIVRLPFTAKQRHIIRDHAVTFIVLCVTGLSVTAFLRGLLAASNICLSVCTVWPFE